MSFDAKAYKREWMRRHRARQHQRNLIAQGKCPISEILLTSRFHDPDCPCGLHHNIDAMKREAQLRIKVSQGIYTVLLIKEGQEIPFNTYVVIKEGGHFDIQI